MGTNYQTQLAYSHRKNVTFQLRENSMCPSHLIYQPASDVTQCLSLADPVLKNTLNFCSSGVEFPVSSDPSPRLPWPWIKPSLSVSFHLVQFLLWSFSGSSLLYLYCLRSFSLTREICFSLFFLISSWLLASSFPLSPPRLCNCFSRASLCYNHIYL